MFEALKKLFSRSASAPSDASPFQEERTPAAAPASRTTAEKPIAGLPGVIPKQSGDMIVLPLNEILARLPATLAPLVLAKSGGTFSVPSSVAVEQLRTGAVRISFSQLRRGSPPGTFADNAKHDETLVDLPLPLILAALGPAGLARRSDQKRVDIPDEVKGVFAGKKGVAGAPTTAAAAPTATPTAPKPVAPSPVAAAPAPPKPPAVAPVAPVPTAPRPVAPAPVASRPVTPIAPPAPAPRPAPVAPRPVAPIAQPTPAAAAKPTTSIAFSSAAPKPATPLPFATKRTEPPPPPPLPPPGVAPAATSGAVVTTIAAVSGAWPEPVRNEIQQFELAGATISIPMGRLEAGVKSGRVEFTWTEVCGWLSVAVPASANGESVVELPLKIVAPLYLAASPRMVRPRKALSIDESVPDLFAGQKRPAAPPVVPEPAPVAVAVVEAPVAAPAVVPPAPEPVAAPAIEAPAPAPEPLALPDLSGTPDEIVQQILIMPGVAGALFASTDGLLVAGRMPAPLKAEMMAAFLPQMLTQISGSTEEVQLGLLRALKFSTSETDCAVYKAGVLCLVVLSRPGETLPEPVLRRIAEELAQLN